MSDQKLRVEIETAATGQGAQQTTAGLKDVTGAAAQAAPAVERVSKGTQQTAAGLKDVTGAAQQAAPALQQASKGTKDLAQGLGQGAAVGNAAVAAISNLSNASQGGASGLIALARAAFATGVSLKGLLTSLGPFGIAAAAISIAIGLISTALRKNEEQAEATREKLAELNKAKLDGLAQQQKAVTEATNEATAAIGRQLEAMDKLADMRTARLIEEEKARGKEKGIPSEVTERNITRIRRDAEDAKIGRELSAADKQARLLEDVANESEQKRITADTQRNQLLGLKASYDQITQQEETMRKGMLKDYLKRGYALPEDNEKLSALQREQDAARERLEKRLGGKDKDGKLYADALKTADEALRTTKEASDAAKSAAEAATAAAAAARGLESQAKPERDKLRSAEDRNARELTDAEKAKIEETRAKARTKMEQSMRTLGPDAVANRIAGGDASLDIELARQLFPKRKFTAPSTPSTSSTPSTPGTGVYRPGETLPSNTAGVFRGALPAGPVDPRNQLTFGQLQPGSDNKDADKVVEALKGTKESVQEQPKGDDTAKAAEALKKTTEAQTKALQESTQKTLTALDSASKGMAASANVLVKHDTKIASLDSQLRSALGRIAALESRTA